MLPFGSVDSHGGPIHDAAPEEWAKHLNLVARLGFTEVDPTDTWVRVADLSPERLADFQSVLKDAGLTIPAISTSRRSVMDPEHGKEYLEYSHRLLDAAAELGVPLVSFGFFQGFTPAQEKPKLTSGTPSSAAASSSRSLYCEGVPSPRSGSHDAGRGRWSGMVRPASFGALWKSAIRSS